MGKIFTRPPLSIVPPNINTKIVIAVCISKSLGGKCFLSINTFLLWPLTLTCVGLVSSSPFGFVSSSPFCVHSHRGLLGWSGALLGWSISPRPHIFGGGPGTNYALL